MVFTGKAGGFIPLYMDTTAAPFTDVRVRQAWKLLIDRPKALSSAVSGYGLVANDVVALLVPL